MYTAPWKSAATSSELFSSDLADDPAIKCEGPSGGGLRCVLVKVYFRRGDKEQAEPVATLEEFKAARGGIISVPRF